MENDFKEKMLNEKFNWFGGNMNKKKNSNCDVSISRVIWDSAKKRYAYGFTFRNNIHDKLGNQIQIAVYKNRVLFRPCGPDDMKISLNPNNKTKHFYCKLKEDDMTKVLLDFIGDYDLKYDEFYEIYYIEKEV